MYLSLTKTKFQKRGGWDMKKSWLSGVLMLLAVLPAAAQQVMYSNLKELVENRGDTVTTLKIEKRTKNQIYLMGGADYRITVDDNPGLCRYLKSRCYAVRVDTSLYVNCRKMRYKRLSLRAVVCTCHVARRQGLLLCTACGTSSHQYHDSR